MFYHLGGLYSLVLAKYQVRIKLSDVMCFHVVDSELIGVFDLSNRIYIESVKTVN